MESNDDVTAETTSLLVSTTVLLPGTRLTFQFKGDERQELIENALYRDGRVVLVRTEEGELAGDPPPVGTLAEILDAARPAPDRLMAVLGGMRRVEIGDLSGSDADRRVEWSAFEPRNESARPCQVRAGDVLGLLDRLRERGYEMAGALNRQLDGAEPSKVADIAASVAFDEIDVHQELLEEPDVLARLERVEAQLDDLLNNHGA